MRDSCRARCAVCVQLSSTSVQQPRALILCWEGLTSAPAPGNANIHQQSPQQATGAGRAVLPQPPAPAPSPNWSFGDAAQGRVTPARGMGRGCRDQPEPHLCQDCSKPAQRRSLGVFLPAWGGCDVLCTPIRSVHSTGLSPRARNAGRKIISVGKITGNSLWCLCGGVPEAGEAVSGTGSHGKDIWWHWVPPEGHMVTLGPTGGAVSGTGSQGRDIWWHCVQWEGHSVALGPTGGTLGGTGSHRRAIW